MGRKVWTTIAPTGQGGDKKARGRSTAAKIWKNFSRRAIAQGAREILEEVEDEIHAPSMVRFCLKRWSWKQ